MGRVGPFRAPTGSGAESSPASRTGRFLLLLVGWILLVPPVAPAQIQYNPDDDFVKAMCRKGVRFLEADQKEIVAGGELILAAIAVVEVSKRYDEVVPVDHPIVVKAVEQVLADIAQMREHLAKNLVGLPTLHGPGIYRLAISIIFLTDLGPDRYRVEIQEMVDYFLKQQKANGAFGYPNSPNEDTSQSQYAALAFALLKIHEIPVDPNKGAKLLEWFCNSQLKEGSLPGEGDVRGAWVYHYQSEAPYTQQVSHPMFVAGASSVYLLADYLNLTSGGGVARGSAKQITGIRRKLPPSVTIHYALKEGEQRAKNAPLVGFDRGKVIRAKSEANEWLKRNFTIQTPTKAWTYYYMYALERYAYFREKSEGGMPEFPTWYDQGVEFLAAGQSGSGSWAPPTLTEENQVNSTCLALLFLVRSSQILLKDPRQGPVVSNHNIWKDGILREGENGTVKVEKGVKEVADVLQLLREDTSIEQMQDMLEELKPALIEFNRKEGKSRAEIVGFLRGLVTDPDAYRRLTAVRFLAGTQDLDNVPALLRAVGDEELEIAIEAHNGLRLISRKLNAFPLSSKPTIVEMRDLKKKWTEWYLGIRPGAVLLD